MKPTTKRQSSTDALLHSYASLAAKADAMDEIIAIVRAFIPRRKRRAHKVAAEAVAVQEHVRGAPERRGRKSTQAAASGFLAGVAATE